MAMAKYGPLRRRQGQPITSASAMAMTPPASAARAALEEAGGPHEENQHQQDIGRRLVDLGGEEERGELLDEAEEEPAEERARIVPGAAQHDHQERLEGVDPAHLRLYRHHD